MKIALASDHRGYTLKQEIIFQTKKARKNLMIKTKIVQIIIH